MSAEVIALPESECWSPGQALAAAAQVDYARVAAVGATADGAIEVRLSRMSREEALWLAEELRLHTLRL